MSLRPKIPKVITSTPKKSSRLEDPTAAFPSSLSPIVHPLTSNPSIVSKKSSATLLDEKNSKHDLEEKRSQLVNSRQKSLDISSLSVMPLSEQFPSINEMKNVRTEEIADKFFADDSSVRKSYWFPELVTRLGVDPSNMVHVLKMFDENQEQYGVNDLRAEAFLTPGDGKEMDISSIWDQADGIGESRFGNFKNRCGQTRMEDDDYASSDDENPFVGDSWVTNRSGFIDTSIPNFHRARVYASGRRRGTVNVIEELHSMKSDLEDKITEHQFKVNQLKNAATVLEGSALKFNEISGDVKQRLRDLLEEFDEYESCASEWQILKKNTENGLKSLAEFRKHLELIHRSQDSDINENMNEADFEKYMQSLHDLAPTRAYLERLSPNHSLIKKIDMNMKMATEKILFKFQQTLCNSDLKPILLGDAIRIEIEKIKDLSDEEVPFAAEPVELIDYSASAYDQLVLMSKWLTECRNIPATKNIDFTHVYHQIRDEIMSRSLRNFSTYMRNNSETWVLAPFGQQYRKDPESIGGLEAKSSLGASLGTLRRNLDAKKRKASQKINSSGKLGSSCLSMEVVLDLDRFVVKSMAVLKLIQVEASLIRDIIPEVDQALVFERIVNSSMIALVEKAKKVIKIVTAFHDGQDYQSVLYVLNSLSNLENLLPAYQRLLSVVSELNFSRWLDTIGLFESSAWHGIEMFLERIRRPESSAVPVDGAVHELAIRAMALVSNMHTWTDLCSRLFANRTRRDEEFTGTDPDEAFPRFLSTILSTVNSTVVTRSHMYSDVYLACIFRINNHSYILNSLRATPSLLEEIKRVEPGIEQYLIGQIQNSQVEYQKCWYTFLDACRELLNHEVAVSPLRKGYQSQSELSSKEREMMKNRCTIIRKEIDEIYKKQVEYNVPDSVVRNDLIQMNKELIGSQYTSFYENYIHIDFTSNKKKYIPFTPNDFMIMLGHFFVGGAKNIPQNV